MNLAMDIVINSLNIKVIDMQKFFILMLFLQFQILASESDIILSKDVFNSAPFSSEFMEDGALIRNINYKSVKALVKQVEAVRGIKLIDRGEAHITVITPPEAQGWFHPSRKGINFLISYKELHLKYAKIIQQTKFSVVCIGEAIEGDKHVFFLVVDSPALREIRSEIATELEARSKFSGLMTHFDPNLYDPHITIGYIGGDVFSKPKDLTSCSKDLKLVIKK